MVEIPMNVYYGEKSSTLSKWKINDRGSVATVSDLPSSGNSKGDMFNILEDGSNYIWNGSSWDSQSSSVFIGADASSGGVQGLVPAPSSSDRNKFLKGSGSFEYPDWSEIDNKPSEYTPESHAHGNVSNDGKVGTVSGKPLITGSEGVVEAGSFGSEAGTFCEGNDARLSDSRTPLSHVHGNVSNDGKVGSIADLPIVTGEGGQLTVDSFAVKSEIDSLFA